MQTTIQLSENTYGESWKSNPERLRRSLYDGLKAIEEAQRLKPDVVVLNVSMPILNGMDAARKIKTELPRQQS